MRKSLIAVAVIAAGAFAYYQWGHKAGGQSVAELEYVPADTVLFSGQLEPIDMVAYLKSMGVNLAQSQKAIEDLSKSMTETQDPQAKFLTALMHQYSTAIGKPDQLTATLGVKPQLRSMMYFVGLVPVVKIELTDAAAFSKFLDDAEKSSGFSHTEQQINNVKYRQYHLTHEELSADLLIRADGGWATMALTSSKFAPEHVAIAIGAQKPEQNLANTPYLAELSKKYQLNPAMIGFFSSEQAVKVVTSTDGNRLAKDVHALFGEQLAPAMAAWRTPACTTDVAAIAKSWPGMFFDSTYKTDAKGTVMTGRMLIPTENKDTVAALSTLRGFIPTAVSANKDAMLHLGFGVDVGQVSASVGKLWNTLTQTKYSCEPLLQMQQAATQSNPMAVLAMTGMANGVQGVSVALNQFELDAQTQQAKAVDALVSISATNARAVVEGFKAMSPEFASIQLPKEGEAMDLASFLPPGAMPDIKPVLQLNNSHLVVSVGEKAKAQADAILKESSSKNGLMSLGVDYKSFFTTLLASMPVVDPAQAEQFELMKQMDMKAVVRTDIDQHGFVMTSEVVIANN